LPTINNHNIYMKNKTKDNMSIIAALFIGSVLAKIYTVKALPAMGVNLENINPIVDILVNFIPLVGFYIPTRYALIKIFKIDA